MRAILVLCTLFLGLDDKPDNSVIAGLLEAAYAPMKDVTFEYEGKMTFPEGGKSAVHDADGLFDDYSGVVAERRDGSPAQAGRAARNDGGDGGVEFHGSVPD